MSRVSTILSIAVITLLTLVTAPAPLAEAAKESKAPADLRGVAYNYAGNGSMLILVNLGSDALRAVVVVRDSSNDLLGCGLQTLRSGEQVILYIKNPGKNTPLGESVLTVTAYGVGATQSLLQKLNPVPGLTGSLAQVQASTGEINASVPMFPLAANSIDRQSDLDACFGAGIAGTLSAEDNIVTTELPDRWRSTVSTSKAKKS
jgi:hypothetical protein